MTYTELTNRIKQRPKMPQNEYWQLITSNATLITQQTLTTPKTQVAHDLGMTPQVFSTALKMLVAISGLETKE